MQELDAGQRLLLDQLTEEYQQRYGVAVEYLKSAVGSGEEYVNSVARVVISSNGAWFECLDQPMEFSGAAGGSTSHHFVTDSAAISLLESLRTLAESAAAAGAALCRLLILYEAGGIVDEMGAHLVHAGTECEARRIGQFRPGKLPLFFRCRFDSESRIPNLALKKGVIVCLTGLGERNLVLEIPYDGPDMRDLAYPPAGLMPQ